jgi:hypothetical protein
MTRILITAAVLTLFATSAYAQREGGAFFGPFSSGNSSGGNFGSRVNPCTWSIDRPKCKEVPSIRGKQVRARKATRMR